MRPDVFSPQHLTPEQRAREVAKLLATGLLRLVRNATASADLGETAEAKPPSRPTPTNPVIPRIRGTRRHACRLNRFHLRWRWRSPEERDSDEVPTLGTTRQQATPRTRSDIMI